MLYSLPITVTINKLKLMNENRITTKIVNVHEVEKLKQFNKELEGIRKEIDKNCCEAGIDISPMYDGPINPKMYLNSNIKIAWLLKEGYDSETGKGGWSYTELAKENAYEHFFRWQSIPTWHPIIYTTYGILNGFKKYNEMPDIKDNPGICEVVNNIAIINVQKMPAKGGSISNFPEINKAFDKNFKLLEKQIALLNPDILIGCNTMQLYKNLFEIASDKGTNKTITDYYIKNGKLYIDAYHPARRGAKEVYVNEIIEAAQDWFLTKQG